MLKRTVGRLSKWLRPLPRHLHAMGYTGELGALAQRNRRCRNEWQAHLQNTRALIAQAAAECPQRNKVLIVGSGLLLDIPLQKLAREFREVVLADIAHFRRIRRVAARYGNVRLAQVDVTGLVEAVYALGRARRADRLPEHRPSLFLADRFDLVVSANILSQLPVIPNGYLTRCIRDLPSAAIDAFSRRLVENHLDWLAAFPGVVCLVADLERLFYRGPQLVKREASLWGVELPEGASEWIWDIAPRPEMDLRYDISHRVAGYPRFPKQAWLAGRARRGQRERSGANSASEIGLPEASKASNTFF